jgi:hypothetical protein
MATKWLVLGTNLCAAVASRCGEDQGIVVAVKGASAAVHFGGRRRGEVVVSVASMRERKKTIVFPRLGPTSR